MTAFFLALMLGSVMTGHASAGDPEVARLTNLVLQDCGSCHGMTLKGGLGPPLRPQDLQSRSVEAVAAIIREGVPGTPMPPWKALLSDEDIHWISQALKSGVLAGSGPSRRSAAR